MYQLTIQTKTVNVTKSAAALHKLATGFTGFTPGCTISKKQGKNILTTCNQAADYAAEILINCPPGEYTLAWEWSPRLPPGRTVLVLADERNEEYLAEQIWTKIMLPIRNVEEIVILEGMEGIENVILPILGREPT